MGMFACNLPLGVTFGRVAVLGTSMLHLSRRLKLLLSGSKADAAKAIIATLDYALPEERDAIAIAAIETNRIEAVAAVLRRLELFDFSVAAAVVRSPRLEAAIERLLSERRPKTTANAINAIAAAGEPRLLRHLLGLLDSPVPGAAARAGQAYLKVVIGVIGEHGRKRVSEERAQLVDEAISAGLESYPEHRNRDVLIAAAVASVRPGPMLRSMLKDVRSPACLALRSTVRDLSEPLVRRNLINWLSVPALSGQVQRWMHRLTTPEHFSDLLIDGHLLRDPARRRAARRIDRPKQCVPAAAVATQIEEPAQRWLPDLIATLALPTATRIDFLRDFVVLPNPLARARAATDLAALAAIDEQAWDALKLFCLDRDRSVARLAALHALGPAAPYDKRFFTQLTETARPDVAERACLWLAEHSVEDYFVHWLEIKDQQRLAIAHRLVAMDRGPFVAMLRDRIVLSSRAERLAAISIARRLRLVAEVEEPIFVQATSTDGRIAAEAVSCLVQSQHPRRVEAARTALRHQNDRVRANAIEVIAAFDEPRLAGLVTPFMAARENRVRANAIASMIECKSGAADAHLRAMLRDSNPLHRISALWVAKRHRVSAVVDELAALAITDPLPPIRDRAAATGRLILLEA